MTVYGSNKAKKKLPINGSTAYRTGPRSYWEGANAILVFLLDASAILGAMNGGLQSSLPY